MSSDGIRHRHAVIRVATLLAWGMVAFPAYAQPVVIKDVTGDAVIRRTDLNNDGSINPNIQRLPDIVEMRIGGFAPTDPTQDLFAGGWSPVGAFVRFDLVLVGLINPPGPVAFDDDPEFDPFRYGPNPIHGWLEFDLDADENTGGELDNPSLRYLGNVGRFGGLPGEARFAGRLALDYTAFDYNILTPPCIEKSGEEFHIAFLGEHIDDVFVAVENSGGSPGIFDAGETWDVRGDLFHRAHGFEAYAIKCAGNTGRYQPVVTLRFTHDTATDRTTVSLVYPLTNAASAAMIGPNEPVDGNNGCDDDQNSILEALEDLTFSATHATSFDRNEPDFQLIAGWEFKTPNDYLDSTDWRIASLVGTSYGIQQADGARYIWTDVWPNPRIGDFDANCKVDVVDGGSLLQYISTHDGQLAYDADGNGSNGSLRTVNFAQTFCFHDTTYDGYVQAGDQLLAGDMDLNLVLNVSDIADFVQALVEPSAYSISHGGVDPVIRGDMNCDGTLDGLDMQVFVNTLLGG